MPGNSNLAKEADLWGTIILRDSGSSGHTKATISYPDEQIFAEIYMGEESATIAGSGGDGTLLPALPILDTEIASVEDKNLIVVGGSCVNSVAASLLGGALCGADFESKTGVGAGSFLIQTFDRSGGKVATLVAVYNAGDTTNAAKYLTTQKLDVEKAGTKYKGTSATEATMSSEASSAGNATG